MEKVPLILTGYKDKMDELLQKYQLKIVEKGKYNKYSQFFVKQTNCQSYYF